MDIRDIVVDEASNLADALGVVVGDRSEQVQPQRRENVDEVVVGSELQNRLLVALVEVASIARLDELQGVLAKLFSVTDSDVECRGHGWCRDVGETNPSPRYATDSLDAWQPRLAVTSMTLIVFRSE